MATTNLGKVSVTPKGEYDPIITYERLDIISHNGSSYIVKQASTGVTPIEGEFYALIAEKGDGGSFVKKAYKTYAAMDADKANIPANSSVDVTNDLDESKNGAYIYDGVAFTRSQYDSKVVTDKIIADTAIAVQDAINNTAIEGGVLADTFVTVTANGVDTMPRSQRDVNTDAINARAYVSFPKAIQSKNPIVISGVDRYTLTEQTLLSSNQNIRSQGGNIEQITPAQPSLLGLDTVFTSVDSVKFKQDNTTPIGGGTENNHFQLKYNGGRFNTSLSNDYQGQYALSFGYGSISLPTRRHEFGIAIGNTFHDLQSMAIQNLGASYTTMVGNVGDATDSRGVGTVASQHAVRMSGYSLAAGDTIEAPCVGVVAAGNAFKGFARGYGIQNASSLWSVSSQYIENSDYAVQLFVGSALSSRPKLGQMSFTASNVKHAIGGEGYNHCSFDFIADASNAEPNDSFINEFAVTEAAGSNRYSGIIKDYIGTKPVVLVRYDYTRLDLTITNSSASGVLISANNCVGDLIINTTGGFGISITGNNNNIRVIVSNATTDAVAISGSGNTVDVVTSGKLNMTGSDNVIRGKVVGTVTNSGTNNNLSGLAGFSDSGFVSATTSATGEVVITVKAHASSPVLGFMAIVQDFTNNYSCRVKSKSGNNFTIVVFDSAGAPVANKAVGIRYVMQ